MLGGANLHHFFGGSANLDKHLGLDAVRNFVHQFRLEPVGFFFHLGRNIPAGADLLKSADVFVQVNDREQSDLGVAGLGQIDGHADGVPGGHGAVHGDQDLFNFRWR